MTRTLAKNGKTVSLEDYAFYQGAQGIPADQGLAEIEYRFAQEKAKIEGASVERQKPLEAILARNGSIRAQVEAAWNDALVRFGNHPPPVVMAYIMAALGPVALLVDAALTGPSLDALNITNPIVQYIAAFALASLAAVIFHLAVESFESESMKKSVRLGYRCLACFAIIGLSCWGILRGHEVAFGADLAHNPLGAFLHGHFILASVVFCFITVGSPLAAAFAVGHAATIIQDARKWHGANRQHQELIDSDAKAKKDLEAEQEKTIYALRQIGFESQEWQSCFHQYHRRGEERGGNQEPFWTVVLKAIAVGLLVALITLPLERYFWPFDFLPLVAGCAAFVHFRRVRITPSYRQFRRREATHFTVSDTPRTRLIAPQPPIIDATLEESK